VSTYARPDNSVQVDPAVAAIAPGIREYRSRSQANAMRAAALGDPEATLHVVLPTGTGKSIVGLAPGLLLDSGTTVVVVPTIALALDQERNLRARFPSAHLPRELAYYGDRSEDECAAIKERLRNGTQRVLFTSPEALVTGLAQSLRVLAARGELTHLIIDEAHLVRSWGLSFRPEFQIVASLLSELRELARAAGQTPPRVALLTATLSEQGLILNDGLFRGSEESLFVGSTFLRTELRYLQAEICAPETRLERVIEALRHLPRPAIVYTTRKTAAEEIATQLRDSGFGRTAIFHGDIGSQERLEILQRWSGDGRPTSYDVVVGTSAFGLGVDQSDVRTVVHACIPATVDRFYQEVGRAGRDGHAALSVWIPATVDKNQSNIEKSTVLGDEKAWKRWQAMRSQRVDQENAHRRLVLDTSVIPPNLDIDSDKNRLWNRNTLVLMQRAGLLDLENIEPPKLEQEPGESEESWSARVAATWEVYVRQMAVRVRPHITNLDEESVVSAFKKVRSEIKGTEAASSDRVGRLLALTECWGKILQEEYTYTNVGPMRATQIVAAACSGCPASEHVHQSTYRAAQPIVAEGLLPNLRRESSPALRELSLGRRTIVVTYPKDRLRSLLGNLLQTCVNNGIRGVFASPSLVGLKAIGSASKFASEGLVMVDPVPSGGPPVRICVPTLILLDQHQVPQLSWLAGSEGPLRIVVMPEGTRDPEYPDHLVKNIRSPHLGLEDFLRRF
ncbi:protein DpdF, partial [Nocardioides sp. GCM10030258]